MFYETSVFHRTVNNEDKRRIWCGPPWGMENPGNFVCESSSSQIRSVFFLLVKYLRQTAYVVSRHGQMFLIPWHTECDVLDSRVGQ